MFSKHDHTTLERKPGHQALFAYPASDESKARLMAQTAAHEFRDMQDEGIISYINNGQQGPMWVVFRGPKSYGTFFVQEGGVDHEVTFDPSWEGMVETLEEL